MLQEPQFFQQTLDASPGLIWRTGADGTIRYGNPSWLVFTGMSSVALLGNHWFDLVHPDDADRFRRQFTHAHEHVVPLRILCRFRRHDGAYRTLAGSMVPLLTSTGTHDGHVADLFEIDDIPRDQPLRSPTFQDTLTGISTLAGWLPRFTSELERANRYNAPMSLLAVDVAGMTAINDIYAREAGDAVLRMVAGVIIQNTRMYDFPCRWHDDLFLVLLPDTRHQDADTVKEHLCSAISDAGVAWDNLTLKVSVLCATTRRIAGDTTDTLLHRIDEARRKLKPSV